MHVIWAIFKQWDEAQEEHWTNSDMLINPYTLEMRKRKNNG